MQTDNGPWPKAVTVIFSQWPGGYEWLPADPEGTIFVKEGRSVPDFLVRLLGERDAEVHGLQLE
ncbi:hypothetical protein MHEL_59870 [Mycolicibacterium helvum]|uniref:Uncharacterized protein n=1 Tax=Mycolicibacterium helvum TaxID=1534349 RepID=A0A7I7TEV3_9MYCO|nr:hypothetical protein MHEL_59870 [Mycolicibacterium helvum]